MRDDDCVAFLKWALPQLRLRWSGFRKVHRQVCKRLQRRLDALDLSSLDAYRHRLATADPDDPAGEWAALDALCQITISRFFRDRTVFDRLRDDVLPSLAAHARTDGSALVRAWSAGCASGEEPYSLVILWQLALAPRWPGVTLEVVATDANPHLLARARAARYRRGSLREMPSDWQPIAFASRDGDVELHAAFRDRVRFAREDIRGGPPGGPFDLVLCRNLAFTYFERPVQQQVLDRLVSVLRPGGALVIGRHERLPSETQALVPWDAAPGIFRRPGWGLTPARC